MHPNLRNRPALSRIRELQHTQDYSPLASSGPGRVPDFIHESDETTCFSTACGVLKVPGKIGNQVADRQAESQNSPNTCQNDQRQTDRIFSNRNAVLILQEQFDRVWFSLVRIIHLIYCSCTSFTLNANRRSTE